MSADNVIRAWDGEWNLIATLPEGAAVNEDGEITFSNGAAAQTIMDATCDSGRVFITVDSERGRWSGRVDSWSLHKVENLPDYFTVKAIAEDYEKLPTWTSSEPYLPWVPFNEGKVAAEIDGQDQPPVEINYDKLRDTIVDALAIRDLANQRTTYGHFQVHVKNVDEAMRRMQTYRRR